MKPRDVRFLHAIERVPTSGSHWVGLFFDVDVASVIPVSREPHKHSALIAGQGQHLWLLRLRPNLAVLTATTEGHDAIERLVKT